MCISVHDDTKSKLMSLHGQNTAMRVASFNGVPKIVGTLGPGSYILGMGSLIL